MEVGGEGSSLGFGFFYVCSFCVSVYMYGVGAPLTAAYSCSQRSDWLTLYDLTSEDNLT